MATSRDHTWQFVHTCVMTVLLLALSTVRGTAQNASSGLVKVTPLGNHAGELCAPDRAILFEDPTGVRILYDPGLTVDETDRRLGDVHVVLLSHAHGDHLGAARPNPGLPCGTLGGGAANANSNVAVIAAAKNAAVFVVALELSGFVGSKIQNVRGSPTPGCATTGPDNETVVPLSSPCVAILQPGGSRTVRRGGTAVRIASVPAVHPNSIPSQLLDAPGPPPGTAGYGGDAGGYVVHFTNGLTVYLTGDTGMFSDMERVIARFYRPNLVVINMDGIFTMGPDEAAFTIQHLVRPTTVMPSHVNEQATAGGVESAGTRVDRFIRQVRAFAEVILPLSDITRSFDGEGRCIGCR